MRMERIDHTTTYHLVLRQGPPVTIDLAPEFPDGMEITVIAVNGKGTALSAERSRGILKKPVSVMLRDSAEVRFSRVGGIGVLPLSLHPAPGDSARGMRILGESLKGTQYVIDVEGRSGTSAELGVLALDQKIRTVSGGTVLSRRTDGVTVLSVPFEPSARPWGRKQVLVNLQDVER
jgi:hypothetical protein